MALAASIALAVSDPSPEALAQAQLDAYNARDLDAFVSVYAEGVEVYTYPGELVIEGREDFRERYRQRFQTEGLRAEILHRSVLGNRVVDHERAWVNGPDAAPVEVIVIYTVENGLIARVEFLREE